VSGIADPPKSFSAVNGQVKSPNALNPSYFCSLWSSTLANPNEHVVDTLFVGEIYFMVFIAGDDVRRRCSYYSILAEQYLRTFCEGR